MGNSLEGRDTLTASRIHQRGANSSSPASKVWDIATGFCIQTLMVDRLYECTFDQIRILT
jgi:hypothetical protein